MFSRDYITRISLIINCTDKARNEKEVLVSFKYRNIPFEYPVRVMIIPGKDNAYYFDEAKVLFEADYKSGKVRKYLYKRYGLGHLKERVPLPLTAALVMALVAAIITPILVVTLNYHPLNVEVPTIEGLNFSNLEANAGKDFSTNIIVDPVKTEARGLPIELTSVTSGGQTIKNTEYVYTLNADKINASLKIPGEYVKGNIVIDFSLTDTITYTVAFDLNGGSGEIPTQTFTYNDGRMVEEPDIPSYNEYDFIGWYLNDTEVYDFTSAVNSDLTLHAHWDLNDQDAITATKGNDIKNYHTLEEFRDEVNKGTDFTGWTIKLNEYINLDNNEWTPIGTSEHPFNGIFDGNDKAVYNYTIVENKTTPDETIESLGGGLFGYVEGTSEILHHNTPLTDFYNKETYEVTPPKEDTFSCVIKNLKLRHVTTANGRKSNSEDYTAALVSSVKNAYISNIKLNDATINADNKVGGIVGIVVKEGVAVLDKLLTAKTVSVTGSTADNTNHVAGIYARVDSDKERVLALNCINNATVTGYATNTGGITGQSKFTLFSNCINNGVITGKSRTAGIGTDIVGSTFIKCVNNGNVSQTNITYQASGEKEAAGGIASYAATSTVSLYQCQNTATIGSDNNEKITAGIISTGVNAGSGIVKDCVNTGKIKSTHAYDICELSSVPTIKTETSLSALNEHLQENKYIIDNNIVLTEEDKTLIPTASQEKIELNNLEGEIILDLTKVNATFTLDIDNCNVSITGGSNSKIVKIVGSGNKITVDSEMKEIYLSNDSNKVKSTLTINQDTQMIVFGGEGESECDIEANTTVDRVLFSDTGTYTLINKGTISHKAQTGSEHTVCTIVKCNITIYNYGTIETIKSDSGANSFALLFYGDSLVTIYAGENSCVKSSSTYILAAGSANHVYIYYKDGAKMVRDGKEDPFIIENDKVTSEPWIE